MGVKVEIGTMSVQSTSAKSVLDEQVKTCQLLIERFNQFCEDDSLKGKGYTSAKQYSKSVYLPLLNGMLIYLETLSQAIFSLHPKYTSEVGNESLDQDILEKQISAYEIIKQVQEAVLSLPGASKIMSSQTRQSISDSINNLSDQISVIQEKLDKLLAFDSSSSSLFNQLSDLNQAIKEGLTSIQLNKQFQGGVFLLPTNMSWKKKLESDRKTSSLKTPQQHDHYKGKSNGIYGGNQSSPLKTFQKGSKEEKKQLIDIIQKYHPKLDTNDEIEDFLAKLQDEGCAYVAMTNSIFSRFKGTEEEFQKKFGFSMYIEKDGKKIPNYDAAIVDFYASKDNKERFLWFEWTDDSKDKNTEKDYEMENPNGDYKNRVGYGMTNEDVEKRFESYMEEHNIKVDFIYEQEVGSNAFFKETKSIAPTVENYNELKKEGEVYLSAKSGSVFYPVDNKENIQELEGGHIVTITGVTNDGRFIVSTWGDQYTIAPEDIEGGSIQVVKYYE